jgi:hypothetical protein
MARPSRPQRTPGAARGTADAVRGTQDYGPCSARPLGGTVKRWLEPGQPCRVARRRRFRRLGPARPGGGGSCRSRCGACRLRIFDCGFSLGYERRDNCLARIDDFARAQPLIDQQLRAPWLRLLHRHARALNPLHGEIFRGFPLAYHWSVYQSEWATDLVFESAAALRSIYPALVHHAIISFSRADLMRFLGAKVHGNFRAKWSASSSSGPRASASNTGSARTRNLPNSPVPRAVRSDRPDRLQPTDCSLRSGHPHADKNRDWPSRSWSIVVWRPKQRHCSSHASGFAGPFPLPIASPAATALPMKRFAAVTASNSE